MDWNHPHEVRDRALSEIRLDWSGFQMKWYISGRSKFLPCMRCVEEPPSQLTHRESSSLLWLWGKSPEMQSTSPATHGKLPTLSTSARPGAARTRCQVDGPLDSLLARSRHSAACVARRTPGDGTRCAKIRARRALGRAAALPCDLVLIDTVMRLSPSRDQRNGAYSPSARQPVVFFAFPNARSFVCPEDGSRRKETR